MFTRFLCPLVAILVGAQVAHADEIVFGIGADDVLDNAGQNSHGSVAGLLELHLESFGRFVTFDMSPLVALQFNSDGDVFAGLGVYAFRPIGRSQRFLVEASFAGGYLRERSTPTDIDGFRFRTSVGFGVFLNPTSRLTLSIDHILYTDLDNWDPGSEAILLRYTRQY